MDTYGKIWSCKIGHIEGDLPRGADLPLRVAVAKAYEELTGKPADFCFSGWGAELTEPEAAAFEDRLPVPAGPRTDLRSKLKVALNSECAENGSNTPDHVLADYLLGCLDAFDAATSARESWYGVRHVPGQPAGVES